MWEKSKWYFKNLYILSVLREKSDRNDLGQDLVNENKKYICCVKCANSTCKEGFSI